MYKCDGVLSAKFCKRQKILFSEYGKTDFIYIELHFFADPTNFLACIKNVKGEGGLEVEN